MLEVSIVTVIVTGREGKVDSKSESKWEYTRVLSAPMICLLLSKGGGHQNQTLSVHMQRGLSVAEEDQFSPVFFRNNPRALIERIFHCLFKWIDWGKSICFYKLCPGCWLCCTSKHSWWWSVRLINSLCNYWNAEYVSIIDERILYTAAEPGTQWSNQRGNLIYARRHDGGGNKNLWTLVTCLKSTQNFLLNWLQNAVTVWIFNWMKATYFSL